MRRRPARHFVIGDIHGHIRALNTLLNHLEPTRKDRVTFLGDYIDHGPGSKAVIDTIMSLGNIARPLAGNHEMFMLGARKDKDVEREWLRYGGEATLASFGVESADQIPGRYFDWLASLPQYIEDDNYLFVHAGINPNLPMNAQTQEDLMWRSYPEPVYLKNGKAIVCGHTPRKSPLVSPKFICLDSGIASGGFLSCYECRTGEVCQVNLEGELFSQATVVAA